MDTLSFSPIDSKMQQTKKQCVRLFGYGGYDKIEFSNLTKDTSGKFWMSLGKLDNQGHLSKNFLVTNNGVLPAFVHISCNNKTFSEIVVKPNFFVIIPNEQKHVTVENIITASSFKNFQKSLGTSTIIDLGNLNIVTGTETNRGRLRRLCRKISDAGSSIDSLSNVLKEHINGEVMPSDLNKFKESANGLKNILELFNYNEVVVTVEHDPDQTILMQCPDESAMYLTLCEETVVSGKKSPIFNLQYI